MFLLPLLLIYLPAVDQLLLPQVYTEQEQEEFSWMMSHVKEQRGVLRSAVTGPSTPTTVVTTKMSVLSAMRARKNYFMKFTLALPLSQLCLS